MQIILLPLHFEMQYIFRKCSRRSFRFSQDIWLISIVLLAPCGRCCNCCIYDCLLHILTNVIFYAYRAFAKPTVHTMHIIFCINSKSSIVASLSFLQVSWVVPDSEPRSLFQDHNHIYNHRSQNKCLSHISGSWDSVRRRSLWHAMRDCVFVHLFPSQTSFKMTSSFFSLPRLQNTTENLCNYFKVFFPG